MPKPVFESLFELEDSKPKAAPKVRKRAAQPKPEPALAEPSKPVVFQARAEQVDWVFYEAISVLGDILHPDERQKYAYILDPFHENDALKKRVEDWRERNGISN